MNFTTLRFLHLGHLRALPDWRMRSHQHPRFHELIVVVGGKLHVAIDGNSHVVGQGGVLLYHQGHPHAEATERKAPVESFFVGFECAGLPSGMPTLVMDEHGRIQELVRWMAKEQAHPGSEPVLRAFLEAALAEWLRLASHPQNPLIASTRDFILRHIDEPLPLGRLAAAAGMSKFHFLRRYRDVAGITPMADLRRLRAEFARGLIISTDLSLKVVSARAGLVSHVNLARAFRQHFGMAPGQARTCLRPQGTGNGSDIAQEFVPNSRRRQSSSRT